MIKVSIIVPVYNVQQYLEKCLDAILSQSLKEIEVLLVNDGSTDGSFEICNRYKMSDDRIRVFSIKNSGAAVARNIGLKNATGEYVGFVDSDDWIEPKMYELLYLTAKEENADIVSCNFIKHYLDRQEKNITNYESGYYSKADIIASIYPYLICSNELTCTVPFTMVTKLFRRSLISKNEIWFDQRLKAGQDFVFSTSCILFAESFFLMRESYFYHYRYNIHSRTNRYLPNSWQVYKDINNHFKNIVKDINYDFSRQIKLDLLHGAMSAIYYECKDGNPSSFNQKLRVIKDICNEVHSNETFNLVDNRHIGIKRKVFIFGIRYKLSLFLYILCRLNKLVIH